MGRRGRWLTGNFCPSKTKIFRFSTGRTSYWSEGQHLPRDVIQITLPTLQHPHCGCCSLKASCSFLFLSEQKLACSPASFSSKETDWSRHVLPNGKRFRRELFKMDLRPLRTGNVNEPAALHGYGTSWRTKKKKTTQNCRIVRWADWKVHFKTKKWVWFGGK